LSATRYVNAKKGVASGTFDSPLKPARSVGDALKVAKPGDIIEIQDDATYKEDELVIDKPLTIVSSHALANVNADPTNPAFDARVFPELTVKSNARNRVLRVVGTPATRGTAGPVVLKGLRITGGHSLHASSDPALGAGGGISVIDIDNVTIERCVIMANSTETAPIGAWPEPDRIAFRTAVIDLVGEIVSPTFESFVNTMIDAANKVLSIAGFPALAHLSRSAVLAGIGKAFDAKLGPGRPNAWLAGQAFGGGGAAVWASPTLRRCLIRGNNAQGRGAGFAVVGYGWPTLDACWVDGNRSGSIGRRDGGGLGCEIALPGKLTRNLSEVDLVKFLTAKLVALKAAVASPTSAISISDVIDYVKWLANPLQPSPPAKGLKAVVLDLIGARWDAALDHLLYFASSSALNRNRWDAWNKDEIERAQKTAVAVTECRLSSNWCADDGGGLYASVLSRVRMSKTKVVQNTAQSSGGGVRLSMGSAGEITGCELTGNTAVVDDPSGKLIAGGGGLSARNVDLTLTDTRIGPSTSGIGTDSNVCSDHAGGGVAFQSDTEGNLAGVPDLWTAIMVEVFGVKSVQVSIKSGCAIMNNGAGFDAKRGALGATSKAKGGGIWLLQGEFPDAPRVDLTIEAVASIVKGNVGQTRAYTSKVQPGVSIATANEVCIQDLIGRKEWTESNNSSLISSGKLHFTP
jgi:hypothetical protein